MGARTWEQNCDVLESSWGRKAFLVGYKERERGGFLTVPRQRPAQQRTSIKQ